MQTRDTNHNYKNDLDKVCFQHDMAYGKCKDLTKRAQSDKVLRGKAFKIAGNPKYDGDQRRLASIIFVFFDKKSRGSDVSMLANKAAIKSMPKQQLEDELDKPFVRKFKRRRCIYNLKTIFRVLICN